MKKFSLWVVSFGLAMVICGCLNKFSTKISAKVNQATESQNTPSFTKLKSYSVDPSTVDMQFTLLSTYLGPLAEKYKLKNPKTLVRQSYEKTVRELDEIQFHLANLASVKTDAGMRLERNPLITLPEGIQSEYRPFFQTYFEAISDYGEGKFFARKWLDNLLGEIAAEVEVTKPTPVALEIRTRALYSNLLWSVVNATSQKRFFQFPDKLLTAGEFYGLLIKDGTLNGVDVAFGPKGSMFEMPVLKDHGMFTHIQDMVEWMMLSSVRGQDLSEFPNVMRYMGISSLLTNVLEYRETLRNPEKLTKREVEKMHGELTEMSDALNVPETDLQLIEKGQSLKRDFASRSFTLNLLNCSKAFNTERLNVSNHYPIWSLFFDWQNIPPEACVKGIPNTVSSPPYFNKEPVRKIFKNLPRI